MIHNTPQAQHKDAVLKAASRPEGVTQDDAKTIGFGKRYLFNLNARGQIFTIKTAVGSDKKRYFSTQELADEFYKDRKPSKKTHPKAKKPLQSSEYPVVFIAHRNTPGGPARAPGEPIITPQTKFTFGKKPPEQTFYTNTFSRFA